MPAPLSMDVRRRFAQLVEGGMSGRAAAARLLISPATGVRFARRVRLGEDIVPAKCGRRPGGGKLGPVRATLLEMVTANRDITMVELSRALEDATGVAAADEAAPLSDRWTAWRRAGERRAVELRVAELRAGGVVGADVAAADLDAELTAARSLAAALDGVRPDAASRVRADAAGRVASRLAADWRSAGDEAGRAAVLDRAAGLVGRGLVAGDDLPGWVAVNLALRDAKADPSRAAGLAAALDGGGGGRAGLDARRGRAGRGAGVGAGAVGRQFDNLGPASAGLRRVAGTGDDRALFDGDGGLRLDFARVVPADGSAPFYLSTHEVTIGQMAALVGGPGSGRGPGAVAALRSLVSSSAEGDGPLRGWQIDGGAVAAARTWGSGLRVARPTPDDPAQAVSPEAAALVARLAGCRLPTAGQWASALAEAGRDREAHPWGLRGWKLRDPFWTFAGPDAQRRLESASFRPDGMRPADELALPEQVWSPEATAAIGAGSAAGPLGGESAYDARRRDDPADAPLYRDLDVLFRPATRYPRDGGLIDLVGNVAEYALDAPASAWAVGSDDAGDPSAAAAFARRVVADHAGGLSVVGGSALSPPAVDPLVPQPVAPERAAGGFADVGFRLAFPAPDPDPTRRLRRAVESAAYLSPP